MTNLSVSDALKIHQDNELGYALDEVINKWIVFYNIDVPAVDDRGEPCESGMRSIPVAEFGTQTEAAKYVDDVENLWDEEDGVNVPAPANGSLYGEPCGDRN